MTTSIEGVKQTQSRIRELGGKTGRRVMRKAVNAAGTPVVKAVRSLAPRGRTRLLKRSITKRLKSEFQRGAVEVRIGARSRPSPDGNPSRYFHLVDQGARPHVIRGRLVIPTSGGNIVRRQAQHPGVRGRRILDRALARSRHAATEAFRKKADQEYIRELRKTK